MVAEVVKNGGRRFGLTFVIGSAGEKVGFIIMFTFCGVNVVALTWVMVILCFGIQNNITGV